MQSIVIVEIFEEYLMVYVHLEHGNTKTHQIFITYENLMHKEGQEAFVQRVKSLVGHKCLLSQVYWVHSLQVVIRKDLSLEGLTVKEAKKFLKYQAFHELHLDEADYHINYQIIGKTGHLHGVLCAIPNERYNLYAKLTHRLKGLRYEMMDYWDALSTLDLFRLSDGCCIGIDWARKSLGVIQDGCCVFTRRFTEENQTLEIMKVIHFYAHQEDREWAQTYDSPMQTLKIKGLVDATQNIRSIEHLEQALGVTIDSTYQSLKQLMEGCKYYKVTPLKQTKKLFQSKFRIYQYAVEGLTLIGCALCLWNLWMGGNIQAEEVALQERKQQIESQSVVIPSAKEESWVKLNHIDALLSFQAPDFEVLGIAWNQQQLTWQVRGGLQVCYRYIDKITKSFKGIAVVKTSQVDHLATYDFCYTK